MSEQPATGPGYTPSERGKRAIAARLAAEDHQAMTAAANGSGRHVKRLDRWRDLARQRDPAADGEQLEQLAVQMRADYYAELGRRAGETRRGKSTSRRTRARQRTERIAREQNPGASDEEIARIAAEMRVRSVLQFQAARSPMHVSSPERWKTLARQEQPDAGDDELDRIAGELKAEHFARAARAAADARARKAEAAR
jgi:hypothetical protein